MTSGAAARHAVVIAGGGPVGLTLALELARHGIATVVLEQGSGPGEGSRAICISRRSMDILDGIGVGEDFRSRGLGWTRGTSFFRNRPVYQLEMPWPPGEKHYPMTNLQQFHMEEFLIARARREPLIELRQRTRLEDLDIATGHVRLHVQSPAGAQALDARFLVACDGARSRVREALGLRLNGRSHEGRYLIADIHMRSDHPTERRAWFDPPSNPGATVLMHRQPDDIWRIDYQLLPGQDAERELEAGRIAERIGAHLAMIGETAPWRLVWRSLYRAHCLALDDYRHGPVLFAGDAAHLVPIFGVRGLNSGIADANNLGWKLAAALRDDAPLSLLDSYSVERRAATLDILAQAEKTTLFMTPPDAGHALMREAVLSLAIDEEFVRPLIDPRQSVPYDYVESPLTTLSGKAVDLDGVRAGAPLPNLAIGATRQGRRHLLDVLPAGFAAIVFDAAGEAAARAAFAEAGPGCLPIGDGEALARERLGAVPGLVILARPDGHVAARLVAPAPEQLRQALWRACGRVQ
ncbi:MAG: FAD-dependent monooxygenase [Alphaproteobacteria bacterium]|nr:FAD-dependent monooxygenase [Alphaproteobacteria bacterium]